MLPPRLRATCLRARVSAMSRVSGKERARRSSLVTTKVPGAAGGQSFAQAGPVPVRAGEAVVDVDSALIDAKGREGLVLDGQVLPGGGDAGIYDEHVRP